MRLAVFVTYQEAFGNRPSTEWIRSVLSNYPLAEVLRIFTKILHFLEGHRRTEWSELGLQIAEGLLSSTIYRPINRAVDRLRAGGSTPWVFTQLHLLNFLKEAIRNSGQGSYRLTQPDVDILMKAYLATHDHFPPNRPQGSSPGSKTLTNWVQEDLVRQALLGFDQPWELALPRYWALWRILPPKISVKESLDAFFSRISEVSAAESILASLPAWVIWWGKARDLSRTPHLILRREGWVPDTVTALERWRGLAALQPPRYREELELEWMSCRGDETWEYSFRTVSRYPIVQIDSDLYCLSLALLINWITDGHYYRILDACLGNQSAVNQFTGTFGDLFHEYVFDLWRRIVGSENVHRTSYASGQREAGDGIIFHRDRIFIYDAKSTRFRRETLRSGKAEQLLDDLKRGILKAAGQLDGAVKAIRSGQVQQKIGSQPNVAIFPIVITATPFPSIAPVFTLLDEAMKMDGLLSDPGVQPLQVIDCEEMELLEGWAEKGGQALDLLMERGTDVGARTTAVKDLLFRRGVELKNARLANTARAIVEATQVWARGGGLDESRIEQVFSGRLGGFDGIRGD